MSLRQVQRKRLSYCEEEEEAGQEDQDSDEEEQSFLLQVDQMESVQCLLSHH